MTEQPAERLMILHDLKSYRVAKGEPDIRGWEVVASDKKKIGKVHELIVDTVEMKVRYLDVDVDNKILETKTNSHILIPIAGAQLDDDDNRVYLNEISIAELTALPPYDHRRITREFETNIASWFRQANRRDEREPAPVSAPVVAPPVVTTPVAAPPEKDFYAQEHFSERDFWGRRRKGRETESYLENDEISPPPPRKEKDP